MALRPLRRADWAAAGAIVVAIGLSVPPLRIGIERSMVLHMAIQMPLLVVAGWLIRNMMKTDISWLAQSNAFGLTGFALLLVSTAYWMLPVSLDRAVVSVRFDAVKCASLIGIGFALKDSLQRAPPPVQLFSLGYTLPMMIWLGLYLADSDRRLCNAYTLEAQIAAGRGLVVLAILLSVLWLLGLLRSMCGPLGRTGCNQDPPPRLRSQGAGASRK